MRLLDTLVSSEGSMYLSLTMLVILFCYIYLGPSPYATTDNKRGAVDEAGDQLEKDIQYVDTKLGKIQIQVIGKISTHANILSIHDIGISSAQCFDRFTEYVQGESPYSKFCMVYLTLPGQYKGASGLNKEMTVEHMVDAIHQVCESCKIQSFIAFGVGMGSYVWLKYAVRYSRQVQGLMLIGANMNAPSNNELWTLKVLMWMVKYFANSAYVQKLFLHMQFGERFQHAKPEFMKESCKDIMEVPKDNLIQLLQTFSNRPNITKQELNVIRKLPMLLLAGDQHPGAFPFCPIANDEENALQILQYMDRHRSSWLKVPHCGRVISAERPNALIEPSILFLNGIGYM